MKSRHLISALLSSLCLISSAASANPVALNYVDIVGQGVDPGNLYLNDEHGLSDLRGGVFTADQYAYISTQSYNVGTGMWTVSITNESSSDMFNTILALETGGFNLTPNSWDGLVGSDPAYYFGTIAAGGTVSRDISVTGLPDSLVINALGADNLSLGTNASIYHTPEPGSMSLALAAFGAAGLAHKFQARKEHHG